MNKKIFWLWFVVVALLFINLFFYTYREFYSSLVIFVGIMFLNLMILAKEYSDDRELVEMIEHKHR